MLEDPKPLLHVCQHGLVLLSLVAGVIHYLLNHTHQPPTTAINLQQLQPQSVPRLTFTQFLDSSIREAPVSAFYSHEPFANYSENTNPLAYEPPPYDPGPSFYDVATDDFCQGDMW